MWSNYLKVALRRFRRRPVFTGITVGGLTVGLACCVLILLFVADEYSFDRFHEKSDRIVRLLIHHDAKGRHAELAVTPKRLGPTLARDYPEIERTVRIAEREVIVRTGEDEFHEEMYFADSTFFEIFSFPLQRGSKEVLEERPEGVVLTSASARRFFGEEEVIGRTLTVAIRGEEYTFEVAAIAEQIPDNSTLQFALLAPLSRWDAINDNFGDAPWRGGSVVTYAEMGAASTVDQVEGALSEIVDRHVPEKAAKFLSYHAEPLSEVHFHPVRFGALGPASRPIYSYLLGGIAFIILAIATINFTTLTLAHSEDRRSETGVRQVLGGSARQLFGQFVGESMLATGAGCMLGLMGAALILPFYEQLLGRELEFALLLRPAPLAVLLGVGALVAIGGGLYPAFSAANAHPVALLRGSAGRTTDPFTRGLLVVQFGLAVGLIASAYVVHRQLRHVENQDVGYHSENVVVLPTYTQEGRGVVTRLRNHLRSASSVRSVSGSWDQMGTNGFARNDITLSFEGSEYWVHHSHVDHAYTETFGIPVRKGRSFSVADSAFDGSILVNEKFVEELGIENPVGAQIPAPRTLLGAGSVTIVGVMADFHFHSLHQPIEPLLLQPIRGGRGAWNQFVYARLAPGQRAQALSEIRTAWQDAAPGLPYSYQFLDDQLAQLYETERLWARLTGLGAAAAVALACMGLFGLAMLAASRRTKEIGIRKVLGAGISRIVGLISGDFMKLVAGGFVLAIPPTYLALREWLSNFAYAVNVGPTVFLVVGLLTGGIALLTVSYHALRAALINPADSLRYE